MEEGEVEVEEKVIWGGGDEVNIIYVVYMSGLVSFLSLGSLSSDGYSSKTSSYSLPIYLRAHYIQYFLQEEEGD